MRTLLLRVGQNTAVLFGVKLISAVTGFGVAAVLGRGLGESGFGQYSFILAWLGSLVPLTEFGFNTILTRDLAAQPEQTARYFINTLVGKSLLALPTVLALLLLAPWLAPDQNTAVIAGLRWGVLWLCSSFVHSTITSIFMAYQQTTPILWLTVIGQDLLLSGFSWLVWQQTPLYTLIAWLSVGKTVEAIVALFFYKQHLSAQIVQRSLLAWDFFKQLWWRSWPFALAGLLVTVQLRANVLILGYLQGDQVVGWYAAADRLFEMGRELPGAFLAALLPALAALIGQREGQALQRSLQWSRWGLLLFSLLVTTAVFLLADFVVVLVYGRAFEPAATALQILMLTLIPASQNNLFIETKKFRGQSRAACR